MRSHGRGSRRTDRRDQRQGGHVLRLRCGDRPFRTASVPRAYPKLDGNRRGAHRALLGRLCGHVPAGRAGDARSEGRAAAGPQPIPAGTGRRPARRFRRLNCANPRDRHVGANRLLGYGSTTCCDAADSCPPARLRDPVPRRAAGSAGRGRAARGRGGSGCLGHDRDSVPGGRNPADRLCSSPWPAIRFPTPMRPLWPTTPPGSPPLLAYPASKGPSPWPMAAGDRCPRPKWSLPPPLPQPRGPRRSTRCLPPRSEARPCISR